MSKTQSPTTAEDRKRVKVIPYALAIGSIKYAMLCTRPIVYPALSLEREYNSDLGVDHWTADVTPCAFANDTVNTTNHQGIKERYVVPARRQKRREHVVVYRTHQAVQASKFYQGNKMVINKFNGETSTQIAPTDEVEPKFRTPC